MPRKKIIGGEVRCDRLLSAVDFSLLQFWRDSTHHTSRYFFLQREDILKLGLKAISPDVSGAQSIDQLRRDSHIISSNAHTAFEDVTHTKIARHLADIDRLALVRKAGISCDNEQLGKSGQLCDDVLDDAVDEVALAQTATDCPEWENGDGRLAREERVQMERLVKQLPLPAVEPQVLDLLLYLIRNRDRVVTREDLLAAVWQGRIVSESALSTRINAARAVPTWTLPR